LDPARQGLLNQDFERQKYIKIVNIVQFDDAPKNKEPPAGDNFCRKSGEDGHTGQKVTNTVTNKPDYLYIHAMAMCLM